MIAASMLNSWYLHFYINRVDFGLEHGKKEREKGVTENANEFSALWTEIEVDTEYKD